MVFFHLGTFSVTPFQGRLMQILQIYVEYCPMEIHCVERVGFVTITGDTSLISALTSAQRTNCLIGRPGSGN